MRITLSLDQRSHLLRIAATILTLEFKNAWPQQSGFVRIEDHMSQVLENLSVPDILNLPVPELAKRFSCCRRHLNRLFHEHFRVSIIGFRMEMRLLKAVSLLRDPDAKVIDVAMQCGFNHISTFNFSFKRRFGVTPREWRKNAPDAGARPSRSVGVDPNCRLRNIGLCPWAGDPAPARALPGNGSRAKSSHLSPAVPPLAPGKAPVDRVFKAGFGIHSAPPPRL